MSSICGGHTFRVDNDKVKNWRNYLSNAIKSGSPEAEIKVYSNDNSAVAVKKSSSVYEYSDERYTVVLYGREGKAFYPAANKYNESPLTGFVRSYRADSIRALDKIEGAFTLVLTDKFTGETLVAVDRMGMHSINYLQMDDGILYASSSSMFRSFPGCPLDINNQSIYSYLYFHVIPGPETIYKNVRKLEPGSYLYIKNSNVQIGKYWEIEYKEDVSKKFDDYKSELFALFNESINEYASNDKIGAFLSGGIDSSTVVGFLSKATKTPVKTFTVGFKEPGYDETEYANMAVKSYGTEQHTYYVTPDDVVNIVPKIAEAYDQPFGNSSAVPAYCCARMANEAGVETLLAGDGGDELFGGNERYAKQYIFGLYDNVPAVLKKFIVEPMLKPISSESRIFPLRKAKRYVEQATIPMPHRIDSYNLLESFGINNVFEEEFASSIDPGQPRAMQCQVYNNARATGSLNKMLALDLKYTLADNDLPKVTIMCDAAGIDVAFPFLNDKLVEFSARLPARYKVNRTRLRFFIKKALKDFLPAEIINKPKHGFGQPFGVWINEHAGLKELVHDSMGRLKQRGIVKHDFIDKLLGDFLNIHPHYYGNMVWILLILEQWYQRHMD